jgi:hypothetical protein
MRKTIFYFSVTVIICLASFLLGMSVTETKTGTSSATRTSGITKNNRTGKTLQDPTITLMEEFQTREEINVEVASLLLNDKLHRVLDIYSYLCRDRTVAHEIITFALRYNIPINLLFALIDIESGFRTDLVVQNPNGTLDHGLMQCNSRTFSHYSTEELLDLRTNLMLGCEYLIEMKRAHNSWEMAVYRYNGIGSRAVKHMAKVINQEREIDKVVNRYL